MDYSTISDLSAFLACLALVLSIKSEQLKNKFIGLVPKSDAEKLICWWLDKQLMFAFAFGLLSVVTTLM